jgi:hypothetical protein
VVNHEGLKLVGTYQLLFNSVDVNLLGQDINILNMNTEGLIVNNKDFFLGVNVVRKTRSCVLNTIQVPVTITRYVINPFKV